MARLGLPTAQRLQRWAQAQADAHLANVFGYHALQAGGLGWDALQANRMPQRWRARLEFEQAPGPRPAQGAAAPSEPSPEHLSFDSRAWPWPAEALDLVVMPFSLERSADAHCCLREVERVLIPEGQLFLLGLNPWSAWGQRLSRVQRRQHEGAAGLSPWQQQPLAPGRVRDWLRLLGFEVQAVNFTGWTPTWENERWVQRWQWLDALGQRWCPMVAGAYMLMATKRVAASRSWGLPARVRLRQRPVLTRPVAPRQDHAHSVGQEGP